NKINKLRNSLMVAAIYDLETTRLNLVIPSAPRMTLPEFDVRREMLEMWEYTLEQVKKLKEQE
ncbi:hypothetical protein, partial [Mycobacterium sp.]|uniref:hypothetical protein n=1 Tax=Mycobacterium sp. TaxID=1785 RepID=UPI003A84F380